MNKDAITMDMTGYLFFKHKHLNIYLAYKELYTESSYFIRMSVKKMKYNCNEFATT